MEQNYRNVMKKIKRLMILHRISLTRAAAFYEIHMGQVPLLEFVAKHDRCTQKELAERLEVSPPSIATSIKRMQKAGLIIKEADDSDLRYNRLTITEKGQEKLNQCLTAFEQFDQLLFQDFSKEDCAKLEEYIDRMLKNSSVSGLEEKSMFAIMRTHHEILRDEWNHEVDLERDED